MFKKILVINLIVVFLLLPHNLFSAMSGGDYSIPVDSLSLVNGSDTIGGDYELYSDAGNFAQITSGGDYELQAGFLYSTAGISLSVSANSLDLGELSLSSIKTASVDIKVSTDSDTGYTVYISEDGELRSGANIIADVVDGEVSAGSEEYGIVTIGGAGILNVDTAISNNLAIIRNNSAVFNQVTSLVFKASISQTSLAGNYSHIVSLSAVANP